MGQFAAMPGIKLYADMGYEFTCEHCGKDSGMQRKTIEIDSADEKNVQSNKGNVTLPPNYFEDMTSFALSRLREELASCTKLVAEGKYTDVTFSGIGGFFYG